jgi:tetratricopeptide (TPR) repeat protein
MRIRTAVLPVLGFAFLLPGQVLAQGYGGTVADMLVRGEALLAQGRTNEAIAQFQEARTLCPTPAETVQSLQGEARCLMVEGKPLPAAGIFEEAASRFPEDPRVADLLYAAGQARQRGGELAGAIDLYRRAIDGKPTADLLPILRFQMGRALRLSARPTEALAAIEGFETAHPDHPLIPTILYTRAIVNHDLDRLAESETIYRRLIESFPKSAAAIEAHFELGAVLGELGKGREGADFYRKYVTLKPGAMEAAAALERAGDLLLFRAPKESVELYGLAAVKAAANPKPALPDLAVGRWLGAKRTVARTLANVWFVGGAAAFVLAGIVWSAVRSIRRRRAGGPSGLPTV